MSHPSPLKLIVLLPLLLACVCPVSFGQEKPQLFLRIEKRFKAQEPEWKVERILGGEDSESITFRRGKAQALVEILVRTGVQDAREIFAGQVIALDNIHGKHMVRRELPGFADENCIWLNRGSDAWPDLIFRKGNVYVTVFGPTVEIVKRFGQDVMAEIGDVR